MSDTVKFIRILVANRLRCFKDGDPEDLGIEMLNRYSYRLIQLLPPDPTGGNDERRMDFCDELYEAWHQLYRDRGPQGSCSPAALELRDLIQGKDA